MLKMMNAETKAELIDSIEAAQEFQKVANGLLTTLAISLNSFTVQTSAPDKVARSEQAQHFMNGAMIVYLFNIWDVYFSPQSVQKYFREEEKKLFYAFKHIRIISAHNTEGCRKGNRSPRMDHADKLDDIMASDKPLGDIIVTEFEIDMSNSMTALDCRNFLADMANRLAVGRIYVGGPHGQIRCVGPDGTGTTDVI